ncbi:MAG: hypothetical protein ACRESZ_17345 [Methylococcales bacterium]
MPLIMAHRRIVGIEDDRVGLRCQDYRDHDRHKVMTLPGIAL